ncbi:MAG: hypothetical protein HBSAPP04_22870 [Ignavibacteriaceae bacterium]|nr:MAG: hypothetical protein EDM75_10000 [Chlorobiota bacterium]GJQ33448.1 MAG: hypothetical protein HBSAPP04_22870 [Ignavibacteriaceae bacterium]
MRTRIVSAIICFFLTFSTLMAQDFILSEGYAQLTHEFVHDYNTNKQNDLRLDPILRDKLMQFYVDVIKREAIMFEIHTGQVISSDGTVTPLDTAIYEYNNDGRLIQLTVSSKNTAGVYQSTSLTFKYDKAGRFTEMMAGKKSVLKLTRDKKGNITKANNTSYTYKKGKLDKVGSMKWNGNYFVDKKKDNGVQDPGHEVLYDNYGRVWQANWTESFAVYAYDTRDRFVTRQWEGQGLKEDLMIMHSGGLHDQIIEMTGMSTEGGKPEQEIKVQVLRIYRDGK